MISSFFFFHVILYCPTLSDLGPMTGVTQSTRARFELTFKTLVHVMPRCSFLPFLPLILSLSYCHILVEWTIQRHLAHLAITRLHRIFQVMLDFLRAALVSSFPFWLSTTDGTDLILFYCNAGYTTNDTFLQAPGCMAG